MFSKDYNRTKFFWKIAVVPGHNCNVLVCKLCVKTPRRVVWTVFAANEMQWPCYSWQSWEGIVDGSSRYNERRSFWAADFDWYHFRPPRPTLTPPNAGGRGSNWGFETWHWNCGKTASDRAKLCIERYWEIVGALAVVANPNPLTFLNPEHWDLKTPLYITNER